MPPNPYFLNYSPYQDINQSQQFYQQPNFIIPTQIAPISYLSKKSIKAKSKKKTKKDHDHKRKKDSTKLKKKEEKPQNKMASSSKDISEKGKFLIKTFSPSIPGGLKGIINYLSSQTSENIYDKGITEVSSNSMNLFISNNNHPKYLLNYNIIKGFLSSSSNKRIWICFDFKNMQVDIKMLYNQNYR